MILGWLIAMALASWSLGSPWQLARRDYVYDVVEATNYIVISPVVSALALSWIVFACYTNHGGLPSFFPQLSSNVTPLNVESRLNDTFLILYRYNKPIPLASLANNLQQDIVRRILDAIHSIFLQRWNREILQRIPFL